MKVFILACLVVSASLPRVASAQVVADSAKTNWVRTESGLAYQVIVHGAGAVAVPGHSVTIHETLTLPDGRLIFSTRTRDNPLPSPWGRTT